MVGSKSLSSILFYFLAAISPISCCCHRFTCAVVHCVPTILNKRYGYDVLSLVDRRSNHRWTKMMISLYINENNNGMNYSSERRRKSHLELRGGGVSSEHHTYSGHESQHSYATTGNNKQRWKGLLNTNKQRTKRRICSKIKSAISIRIHSHNCS